MTHPAKAKDASRLRFVARAGLCLLAALLSAQQTARAEALPAPIQRSLRQAHIPASALSVAIVPLQGRGRAFYLNADTPVNPASLMKLVTTHAALELLGPAYRWPTAIYALGEPQAGVLHGDLYLKGYGDPKLTLERVWLLLRDLRAAGVEEIRGDLVLDRSHFKLASDQSDFDDAGGNQARPYLVTPDALLANFKSVRLSMRADAQAVAARLEPPLPEVVLKNSARPGPAGDCSHWGDNLTVNTQSTAGQARIVLTGEMPQGCSGERYLAVLDHSTYVASLVKTLWLEMGGRWQGGVRQGEVPAQAQRLAVSFSRELPLLLRDINKYSNNGMARQVYLSLGAELGLPSDGDDSASRAHAVLERWLATKGWQWPELVLENGSGLTRNGRISTRHLTRLLADAWQGPWAAEFFSTLPIVAVDGTMKRRLVGEPLAGEAHIKTGSLNGVRAVAGVVRGRNGSVWAVAAVVNHPQATARGKAVLDEVLRQVATRAAR